MNREILDFLKMNDVEYKEGVSLASISPIKIGGIAETVVLPDSDEKLTGLIDFLNDNKIKHKIVGRMSNILFPDEDYEQIVIRTDRLNAYTIEGSILTVSSGAGLPFVSHLLCEAGFSGFEELSGIPGSIAGAIVGNAGAFGNEIADRLIDVRYYRDGRTITVTKENCAFDYRTSVFKSTDGVLLSARFLLFESDRISIKSKMDMYRQKRISTQPINLPSLGSTFKRPGESIFAARLIDECGLKGYSIGGAQISKKHAGFIVNTGGATAKDYVELSSYIANRVYDRFSIHLEREVEIL